MPWFQQWTDLILHTDRFLLPLTAGNDNVVYLVLFFIIFAETGLIVEVDGDTHASRMDYDNRRTSWLMREGYRVVRVANSDVMQNIDGVLEFITDNLPSPSQPSAGPLPLP